MTPDRDSKNKDTKAREHTTHFDDCGCLSAKLLKERDNLLERNKDLLQAEHKLSDAYLRIRSLLNAWQTEQAPSAEHIYKLTEKKLKDVLERNKILESSKTTQEMLDDVKKLAEETFVKAQQSAEMATRALDERDAVKKLFEEMKEQREAYREICIKEREHDFADLPRSEEKRLAIESVDAEAQRIISEKKK